MGSEPQAYAASLLKTCEFCVESPLTCMAGVSGSDLKKRIEAIMRGQAKETLNVWRRVLLVTVGLAVIAGPMVVGLLSAPRRYGQTQAQNASGPTFDVASVKKNKSSGAVGRQLGMPADRFEATSVPLRVLIQLAYGETGPPPEMLPEYQISGGPNWIESDQFDIVAKAGSNLPPYPEGARQKILMLRALLAERFKLVVHHETREGPIYALVLARSDGKLGPKIRRSDVDCVALIAARRGNTGPPPPLAAGQGQPCFIQTGPPGNMMVSGQTLSAVAHFFSELLNRVVLDRTGLAGAFDLDLQFNPEGMGPLVPPPGIDRPVSDNNPSIFTAVQEQLGLKLESTRGPVDVLVIDHVEQPTDNQTEPTTGPSSRTPAQSLTPTVSKPASQSAPTIVSGGPEFDVASIRPSGPDTQPPGIQPILPGGRFTAIGLTLKTLLRLGYGAPAALLPDQVVGGPEWMDKERFDIKAIGSALTAPDASPRTLYVMLRRLAGERFRVQAHMETRQLPIYILVLARRDGSLGPQLRPTAGGCRSLVAAPTREQAALPICGFTRVAPGLLSGVNVPMSLLSGVLAGQPDVERVVRDGTSLTDGFDLDLEFTPITAVSGSNPNAPPSLFTALQQQLGLKLESARGPADVLVVDTAERPTEN